MGVMMAISVEQRVDNLEEVLARYISNNEMMLQRMEADTARLKEEMQSFKERVDNFIAGVERYKEEGRQQNRDMNKKWGEIAAKTGKMVEDLIYPSLPRIIREQFELDTDSLMIRVKRWPRRDRMKEFDAIALAGDRVFLNSTKSDLDARDLDRFIKKDIPAFRTLFPEYNDRKLIGMVASLHVDAIVLRNAEKKGLLVLATGDELMEVKNTPGIIPREW